MITAVIVDDEEPRGRNVLKSMLTKYFPEVNVIGEAGSVKEAKKIIASIMPSLIFLDIEMHGGFWI